jgi:hypothetical protein
MSRTSWTTMIYLTLLQMHSVVVNRWPRKTQLLLMYLRHTECLSRKRCKNNHNHNSNSTVHDVNERAGRGATEVARHTVARRVTTAVVVVVGRRRRRSDFYFWEGTGGERKTPPRKKHGLAVTSSVVVVPIRIV